MLSVGAQEVVEVVTEAIAGVLGVLLGLGLTWLMARRAERVEAYRAINAAYDRVLDLRTAHPELASLNWQWSSECWGHVYAHGRDADARWARYYVLVESCLAFANAVLSARDEGTLSKRAYQGQWRPLVDLILVEHYPIVASMEAAPYLSTYVRGFLRRTRPPEEWRARHERLLAGSGSGVRSTPAAAAHGVPSTPMPGKDRPRGE